RLDIFNQLYHLHYPTPVIHPTQSHTDIHTLLIKLPQHYHPHLITTHFNLNKLSHLQPITPLNLNHLSQPIKPNLHQPHHLTILLTKIPKHPAQPLRYLHHPTILLLHNPNTYIPQQLNLHLLTFLQTSSPTILF
ncbi:PIN domain-containing protein, partial [Staphylococcus epidermidis]